MIVVTIEHTCEYTKTTELYVHFQQVNNMVCKLYHNKCVLKSKVETSNSLKPNSIFIYSSISQELHISYDPSRKGVIKDIVKRTGLFPQDPSNHFKTLGENKARLHSGCSVFPGPQILELSSSYLINIHNLIQRHPIWERRRTGIEGGWKGSVFNVLKGPFMSNTGNV